MSEEKNGKEEVKGIVRLSGKDLKGTRRVQSALSSLKGVGSTMAKAIVYVAGIDGTEKVGKLDDDQIKNLENILENPVGSGIPPHLANRRKDFGTGEDLHLFGGNIDMAEREDISREKSIQSRRGIRHQRGLPVRGQRTRSTGRKGMTVGVERKKLKQKEES